MGASVVVKNGAAHNKGRNGIIGEVTEDYEVGIKGREPGVNETVPKLDGEGDIIGTLLVTRVEWVPELDETGDGVILVAHLHTREIRDH